MESKSNLVAAVVGVGSGLGAALARRFAEKYAVALMARRKEYIEQLVQEISQKGGRALAIAMDAGREDEVVAAFAELRKALGPVDALIYNAGSARWGTIAEISPDDFENAWRVCSFGAFLCAKQVVPEMVQRGSGVLLFTGATAGVKPGPRSAAFGPAKFALRGFAHSLARDLGPKGIHVAYVNIDGVIDEERTRRMMPSLAAEDMLKPEAIADTYWHLAHQDRSSWSLEVDLRPFKEKF